MFRSHGNLIARNRVIHNGSYDGIGILGSRENVVENNLVADNNIPQVGGQNQPVQMRDTGIWIVSLAPGQDSTDNVVRFNQVVRSGFHGIEFSQFAERNTAQSNNVAQNGFGQIPGNPEGLGDGNGVNVEGNANLVVGNNVTAKAGTASPSSAQRSAPSSMASATPSGATPAGTTTWAPIRSRPSTSPIPTPTATPTSGPPTGMGRSTSPV